MAVNSAGTPSSTCSGLMLKLASGRSCHVSRYRLLPGFFWRAPLRVLCRWKHRPTLLLKKKALGARRLQVHAPVAFMPWRAPSSTAISICSTKSPCKCCWPRCACDALWWGASCYAAQNPIGFGCDVAIALLALPAKVSSEELVCWIALRSQASHDKKPGTCCSLFGNTACARV